MTIDEILSGLRRNEGHFAKDAVLAAVAQRDEVIPPLLDVLRDVADNPEQYTVDPDSFILIYAMYLLAQFREARAYPLLVRIFSCPGEMPFDLVGDTLTEGLGKILASVSQGETNGMALLIENEQVNPFVRAVAMDGLLTLVACGQRTREEIVAYFHQLFRKMERVPGYAWEGLANACADIWPDEFMDELRSAWEEGLIDPGSIGWKDIQLERARGLEACLQHMREKYALVTDIVEEMSWWWCFHKDRRPAPRKEAPVKPGALSGAQPNASYRAPDPKSDETTLVPAAAAKNSRSAAAAS